MNILLHFWGSLPVGYLQSTMELQPNAERYFNPKRNKPNRNPTPKLFAVVLSSDLFVSSGVETLTFSAINMRMHTVTAISPYSCRTRS